MLNRTINERKDQCQNLSNFTKEINREIVQVASTLDWTIEGIETDNDDRLICPYDPSHQMGKKILDQHLESCQWKREGYDEFDVPLPESSLPSDSYSSIKMDLPLQNAILQEAKRTDSTLKIESYECPTWYKLYISFFIFFAKNFNRYRIPTLRFLIPFLFQVCSFFQNMNS